MARIVYHRNYDIGCFGIERLHPFDSRKYGRAWKLLRQHFGKQLQEFWVRPPHAVLRRDLLTVHSAAYLDKLRSSAYVAGALEVPMLGVLPAKLLDYCVLRPMRWGTMGTLLAAQEAMTAGCVLNLSGGYHHAKPDQGEGFCIFNDIAIAIHHLRKHGWLSADDNVAYVDLDAHQGNGVCHAFMEDPRLKIFDMFNSSRYPASDTQARNRIDCAIPLSGADNESTYIALLKGKLPPFLDSITGKIGFAVYNAGTDVFERDKLGGLNLSANGIFDRDKFVFNELHNRKIPFMILPSGGYNSESYKHIARSAQYLLESF